MSPVAAQFGYPGQMNLPQNDFTWTWGDQRSAERDREDFSIFGNEAGFRCDLTGKFRPSGRVSRLDIRELESSLRNNMRFIQGAANTMNQLDAQGQIDWAVLKCVKPQRRDGNRRSRQDN